MNADLKARWIKALRSRKYKQGRMRLKSESGRFCCLGVLCVVQGVDLDAPRPGDDSRPYGSVSYPVAEHAAGLDMEQVLKVLANKNDDGAGFREISNWIEIYIPADAEPRSASATAVVSSSEEG